MSDFMKHAVEPVVPAWEAETVRLHYLQDGVSATARPGQRGHAGGGCAAPSAKFYVAELSAVSVLVAASNVPVYALRFEIYVKSDVKIPKRHAGTYFQTPHIPSSMLITNTPESRKKTLEDLKTQPRDQSANFIFDVSQVGLLGVRGDRVEWPITTLYQQTFYARVFPGIDYYAFEGSSGFFNNARMIKADIKKFVIAFSELGDGRKNDGKSLSEFAYVVELPDRYSDKVAEIDRLGGLKTSKKIKEAFGVEDKK